MGEIILHAGNIQGQVAMKSRSCVLREQARNPVVAMGSRTALFAIVP